MLRLKMAAVVAVVVGALGVGASGAGAWTPPTAVGDSVQFQNTGGKVGMTPARCEMTLTGALPASGPAIELTGGAASLCVPVPGTMTPDFSSAWNVYLGGYNSAGDRLVTVTGVKIRVHTLGMPCTYEGILGGSLNEVSGLWLSAGALTRTSSGCLGGATEPFTGSFLLTNLTTSPAQPRVLF